MKHDLAKDPPSRELLERWIDEDHIEDFMNTRSPAWKERNLGAGKLTKKQAIDLIMEEPNLMKRPLVLAGRRAVFGYKRGQYDEVIR